MKKKKWLVVIAVSVLLMGGASFGVYKYLHPTFPIPETFSASYTPLFPVREGFEVKNITVDNAQLDLLMYEATKGEYTFAVTQQNKPDNFQFESLKQENLYLSDHGKAIVINDDNSNTTTLSLVGDNVWLIARSSNKMIPNNIMYDFIDSLATVAP